MSSLFGIINLDSSPVEREKLVQMQQPMLYWGPDGCYLWNEGAAGLGLLQRFNTLESCNEKFPLFDPSRGLVFLSTARIDNREELYHLLDVPNDLHASITDSQLLFNAYRKWENTCVNHLLGDWMFIVYNTNNRSLFLARDHHGATGIYYYFDGKQFIFSSSLKGILALPISINPNMLRLAEVITGSNGDGITTCYENIFRLPPAHYISITKNGLEKLRYWDIENIAPMPERKFEDLKNEFTNILQQSVECRLRETEKTGSMLSGGLDSGTISIVAARILAGRGQRLTSFTSIPLFQSDHIVGENRFADERQLAGLTANAAGNIDHLLIDSADISPMKALKMCLDIHDEPIRNISNLYWIFAIYDKAHQMGIKTILTAGMGNATLSFPPLSYFERNNITKPNITVNDFLSFAGLPSKIIKPLIPKRLLKEIIDFRNKYKQVKGSYINNEFARQIEISKRLKQLNLQFYRDSKIFSDYLFMLRPGAAYHGCFSQQHGAYYGLTILDPTNDKRMIEFSAAIIKSADNYKSIYPRNLLQASMENTMPREVLHHAKRGIQAADLLNRNRQDLEEFMVQVNRIKKKKTSIDVINNSKLEMLLKQLSSDKVDKNTRLDLLFFYRALGVAMFLDK